MSYTYPGPRGGGNLTSRRLMTMLLLLLHSTSRAIPGEFCHKHVSRNRCDGQTTTLQRVDRFKPVMRTHSTAENGAYCAKPVAEDVNGDGHVHDAVATGRLLQSFLHERLVSSGFVLRIHDVCVRYGIVLGSTCWIDNIILVIFCTSHDSNMIYHNRYKVC